MEGLVRLLDAHASKEWQIEHRVQDGRVKCIYPSPTKGVGYVTGFLAMISVTRIEKPTGVTYQVEAFGNPWGEVDMALLAACLEDMQTLLPLIREWAGLPAPKAPKKPSVRKKKAQVQAEAGGTLL